MSYSRNKSLGAELQYNRRLNSRGRNITLRADANYSDTIARPSPLATCISIRFKTLWGRTLPIRPTATASRRQRTTAIPAGYLQRTTVARSIPAAALPLKYSYSKSDRSTYDFSNLGEEFFSGINPAYRSWDNYLDRLANPYTDYLDSNLSRYSEYKTTAYRELMLRMIRTKWQLNAGVMAQPQKSH